MGDDDQTKINPLISGSSPLFFVINLCVKLIIKTSKHTHQ